MLQGGTVVNHDQQFKADVLIEGELITEVAPNIKVGSSLVFRCIVCGRQRAGAVSCRQV